MNVNEALANLTAATRAHRAAEAERIAATQAETEANARCHTADQARRTAQTALENAIGAQLNAEVQS